MRLNVVLSLMVVFGLAEFLEAQKTHAPDITAALQYRNIGPNRGGRVTTVAGHEKLPGIFYMGATGGGVWKTKNFGHSWENISDGYFTTSSIGSIALSTSHPDIIYVGTGSDGIRSNVIIGKGMYRSTNGGDTWDSIGLEKAGQIGAVLVHPTDTNHVLVAAIGNPFTSNKERGVYRSTDGGDSWEKTLYISDQTGVADLEFAPDDPSIVYAAAWEARRKPWTIISGGNEGGIFKSEDGGKSWNKLSRGLPSGIIGKIDLAVSPADPNRVWALIEAPDSLGGVYRSDDRGESFELVSTKKELLDRPFYYCNIDANPLNANSIYVSSTRFWHSADAGKSWKRIRTPHSDNHDLWINPLDTNTWVQANDGGSTVTRDGGKTWSSIENQSTAELYQVAVDDQTPYWLYAGQQDNTTIALPSLPRITPPGGYSALWKAVGGCETGPAIPKPGNPNIIYSNCKGRFGVYNQLTGQERQYYVGAGNMYGHNPRELTFRFQRVSPIHISPHDPDVIYHASQYLHKSTNDGQTWEIISPDLTAFTPETQVISGSPITRDITGEEFFSTIYAVEESSLEKGLIWVGANDGPVHVTRDGGKTWKDVTPEMDEYGRVQTITASPHEPGKAYVAIYRYLLGDFRPYIYRTVDYGSSWDLLTDGQNGIPADHPTRVIREDPGRPGLLYAGTEFGMYLSFNDGESWQPFQQNLPVTPVTDIKVHENDLIISTMGRGFWIIDDISMLYHLDPLQHETTLYQPKPTYRLRYRGNSDNNIPYYPAPGVNIYYTLDGDHEGDISVKIYDASGTLVQSYSSTEPVKGETEETDMATGFGYQTSDLVLSNKQGTHKVRWDMRHQGLKSGSGRTLPGPMVVPGQYRIDLVTPRKTYVVQAELMPDPAVLASGTKIADMEAQVELALNVQKLMYEAQKLSQKIEKDMESGAQDAVSKIKDDLITAEGRYQKPMLLDQISYLYYMLNRADQKPGQDAYDRYDELLSRFNQLKDEAVSHNIGVDD